MERMFKWLDLSRWRAGALLLPFFASVFASVAHAQTWNAGAADQNFSSPTNWSGAAVPGTGATVTIGSSFDGVPTLDTDFIFSRFLFKDTSAGGPLAKTIDTASPTKTLTLTSTNSSDGALQVQNNLVETINANFALAPTSGGITYLSVDNALSLFNAGLKITGALNGTGSNNGISFGVNVNKSHPMLLDLSSAGAATGSGTTTLSQGARLRISNTNQIFTGNVIFNGAATSSNSLGLPDRGVIEWAGASDFTMGLVVNGGKLDPSASRLLGFAAFGGNRTVNVGGAGATLSTVYNFTFGAADSDGTLIFKNPVNNGNQDIHIQTIRGSAAVDARLDGSWEGTSSELDFYGNGIIELNAANTADAGRFHILESTVLADSASAVGVNLIAMTEGVEQAMTANGNAALLTNAAITITNAIQAFPGGAGTATIGGNTAQSSTFNGNITLGNATTAKGVTLSEVAGGTVTFSGVLNEVGALSAGVTKTGAGKVVLSNSNLYAGGTTINQGTLVADNNTAFSTGSVTVNNGGKVETAAGRTITNSITVNAGGAIGGFGAFNPTGGVSLTSSAHLAPGSSIGTVTFGSNGLALTNGSIYDWEWTQASQDLTTVNGLLTLSGTIQLVVTKFGAGPNPSTLPNDYVLFTYSSLSNSATWQVTLPSGWYADGVVVDSANNRILLQGLLVPEPAVAGLMMASLVAVGMRRRVKRMLSEV